MAGDHRLPSGLVTDAVPDPAMLATERERARAALFAALTAAPWDHGFLHTLRRLDCLQPERPRIGATTRPQDDPVRLGQRPSLRFAPSELAAFVSGTQGRPPRLLVYFQGLLGPNGPLPLHLTEYARERERNVGDHSFARFLDSFNHRMLALLYRAWAQAQPAVSFDRPEQDRFGDYLATLSGNSLPTFQRRDAMPDLAKRHYAGHLACQTRHPDGLGAILRHLMGLPVHIQEFIGHWLSLPHDCRLRLGETPNTGALGTTTTLGARVWDHQSKFRVRMGPLGLADYLSLLPGSPALIRVKATVRNYVGDALEWDLNLVLAEPEVPKLCLGAGPRLGWTTWLASSRLGRDGDDLKLDPDRPAPRIHDNTDVPP
jgi:type VI secretion system protein ImpH